MRRAYFLLLVLLLCASGAAAQTTLPANSDQSIVIGLPPGWVRTSDLATQAGFRTRTGATNDSSFHPEGSRPTDLPYAIFDRTSIDPARWTPYEAMHRAAATFETAMDPPSKADRPGTWKSARVSKPQFTRSNVFTFRATIDYVGGINGNATYYVSVIGHYDADELQLLSIWTDQAGRTTYGPALDALASEGLRENIATMTPGLSVQEKAVRLAKVSGVLLILLVLGVQVFVLVRERRQRRLEEAQWHEPLV